MDRIRQYREFIFNMTNYTVQKVNDMSGEGVIKWMEENYPDYLSFIWDYVDEE